MHERVGLWAAVVALLTGPTVTIALLVLGLPGTIGDTMTWLQEWLPAIRDVVAANVSWLAPAWALSALGALFLLLIHFPAIRGRRGESATLRGLRKLFNSAIEPGSRSIAAVSELILTAIHSHPDEAVRPLSMFLQSGAVGPEKTALYRIARVVNGADVVSDIEIQRRLAGYWDAYRLERQFILAGIRIARDCGAEVVKTVAFRMWLRADSKLLAELRDFSSEPEHQQLRDSINSTNWDESVTEAIQAFIWAKQSA
jgi:hypothetical protein